MAGAEQKSQVFEQDDKNSESMGLRISCVVKGYQECPFQVDIGEVFYAHKKIGSRGRAFKVTNGRGQLGHLEKGLVTPLWRLRDGLEW